MLIRLSLIVAIVAALAAGVVNFTVVKGKIQALTEDRDTQKSQKEEAQQELAKTKRTLKETQDTLNQTKQQLADAQNAEQKAENDLAKSQTQVQDLNDKLTKTTQQLNDTQAELAAFKATGLTAQQVAGLDKELRQTQEALDVATQEKVVLSHTVARYKSQLDEILGVSPFVTLPASLKGKVMAVDPKWQFVVLDIGENQGVLKDGELLVSRDGKLVGKVVVSSVQRNRCIANLVPGWQLGDIFEGDQVIPAHPAS
jgi:predicted RNase H-like nuclease (RuvC/YqgF family)